MNENSAIVRRLSAVGIIGNILLVAFKLYAGIAGHSSAMVSDAVHSLSDVFATAIAALGVRISQKDPDKEHPYGHDRYECVASMILGMILLGTGLGIGFQVIKTVLSGDDRQIQVPSAIALVAAVVSIIVKEAMYLYTRHYALKLRSSAFMADAWHHRSDALSSVGSLIGIAGAMNGLPILDSAASVIICICILKVGLDIIKDAFSNMLDTSCGPAYDAELKEFMESLPGVDGVDLVQSRKFGNKIYIDAEISVDGSLSLEKAHQISEDVHDAVEKRLPDVKHIMIHVNPSARK